MRYLFVLLVILVGCGEVEKSINKQPECSNIDGLKVRTFDAVPESYTGVAFMCNEGKVFILKNYKEGKEDGVWKYWHFNGQLSSEFYYKNGKADGLWRSWHDNGQLSYAINYREGQITDNEILYYDKDGANFKTQYYQDGKYVKCDGDCN